MSKLVQVQTLRGNSGVEVATQAVQTAVDKHNAANPDNQHAVVTFVALPPNVKGMQVQLSLLAALARRNGATLIRLNVHNGNVALCGPSSAIAATQASWVPTYNALATLAASTYNAAEHGAKMGFTNAYLCGLTASLDVVPATLAYGLGMLFSFPAPGNGSAYALGASTPVEVTGTPTEVEADPAKPRSTKARARKVA